MSSINDNKKLLQKSLVKEYIAKAEKGILDKQWEVYKEKLLDKERQNTIRNLNERQYYITFLTDLFVNVLGHKLAPDKNHNISIEEKNVSDAGRADGAIYIDDKVAAVIELKSTKTKNINEVTKQGFDYKNNHKGCRIVIISNFETLRIYVDYKIDYEEYNLFNLDKEKFYELYILLSFQGMKNGVLLDIYEKTQGNEVDITNKLYADYSAFKKVLYEDIVTNNPDLDKQVLYKKTQKLIDRILFILFAERRGLLPVNTIANMLKTFEDSYKMQFCDDLYSVFKKWFGFINSGNDRMQPHIFDYNGGLFAEDDVLDNIVISDKVLKDNCNVLIKYDYESEVDVNILGHIFEQSLGENDKKKAEQNGKKKAKSNGIRNQYGIFYTAKYITHYIVENTIGKLCQEKKNELKWNELEQNIAELKGKKDNKTIKAQKREYEIIIDSYREWLLTLKILDPACGSGAFLNEALSFLIEEHKSLDELKNELATGGAGLEFTEIEKKVLEQNIFGVDINEESVEIAKLSLWLRTAKQGRKLSKLSNNIKCGNSLISDPEVAGEKAFDWNSEFPDIMQNGGFDVVIGNPPYVKFEDIPIVSEQVATQNYETYEPRGDIYVVFVERGFNLLKENGMISYIMPNKWLQAGYGKPLRSYMLRKNLIQLLDFGDVQVFEGATTYPCIFVAKNQNPSATVLISKLDSGLKTNIEENVNSNAEIFDINSLSEEPWIIGSNKIQEILERLNNRFSTLGEQVGDNTYYGIKTGKISAFRINKERKDELIRESATSRDLISPMVKGREIKRYEIVNTDSFIITTLPSRNINIDDYPAIRQHFLDFGREKLEPNGEKGARSIGSYKWFETQSNFVNVDLLSRPKIMYQRFQVKPCFTYDENGYYYDDSAWSMITDDKGLLAILNSKMSWWLISQYCPYIQNGHQLIWDNFKRIPIPDTNNEIRALADKMLKLNKQLQEKVQSFVGLLKADLKVELKVPKCKSDVFDMSEEDFMSAIRSKLPVNEREQWLLLFRQYKAEAKALKDEIESTDKTIDAMVYDLYGLSEDEIKIVEA